MTLVDGLIVLSIFGILLFIIVAKLRKDKPESVEKIFEWFAAKPKELPTSNFKEHTEQIYEEKRAIM